MMNDLRRWTYENIHHMNIPGCEIVLSNYQGDTDMRELTGFVDLASAKKAIREKGLKDGEYVLLENTTTQDRDQQFIPNNYNFKV